MRHRNKGKKRHANRQRRQRNRRRPGKSRKHRLTRKIMRGGWRL